MFLLKIAFRNILRNKRRTFLAVSSMTFAIAFIIFLQGFVDGMNNSMIFNSIKNESGDIRIVTREFAENDQTMPIDKPLLNAKEIIAAIELDKNIMKNVELINERITFGVLLNNEGKSKQAVALAGDSEKEKQMLMLDSSITKGNYLNKERDVIISENIAEALNLKVGDTLKIITQDANYGINLRNFNISGLYKTGLKILDDTIFQIGLDDAKILLSLPESSTQQISIMLKSRNMAYSVIKDINKLLKEKSLDSGITLQTWQEATEFGGYATLMSGIYNIIYFMIAFLGGVIIINIIMMIVMERKREIGILKALGVTNKEVLFLFIFEGAILGIIGSFIGTVLGVLISIYFYINGLDLTYIMSAYVFPIDNIIKFYFSPFKVLFIFTLGFIVSVLISVMPSIKASKMKAAESIKSV